MCTPAKKEGLLLERDPSVLTEKEWEILLAVQEHLFPTEPDSPGASDVNAAAYVQWVLTDKAVEPSEQEFLKGSLTDLDDEAKERWEKPFLEMDEAEWHEVLNVNMNASFWLARACLPGMVDAGWGRIINFAGMNAMNGYNGRAHVSTSKHGNWGLTKSLAKEFGPKGITANIISPGPIKSEHDDPAMTQHINEQASKIPIGRLGEPTEIAAVVAMLVSDGGAFVNGQMLQVNGGTQT